MKIKQLSFRELLSYVDLCIFNKDEKSIHKLLCDLSETYKNKTKVHYKSNLITISDKLYL